MAAPLSDITVVELTQMVAGPHAGMHLADLGADVIKIERPGYGEIARNVKPKVDGESFYYMTVNRGKRSVTLDLKSDKGREAFLDIAEEADVILENYTPGTVSELGIGYDDVRERNSDVIYCSVSGFGQTGPRSDDSGVDFVVQAYTGVASMTRDTDDRPLRMGVTVSDLAGAMYAIQSILASLRRRDREGVGDYIDVSLSDSLISFLSTRAGYSFATEEPFPSVARSHVYFAPEGIYETNDGYINISTVTEEHWEELCDVLDRKDLLERPEFETADDRCQHNDELNEILESTLRERPTDEWVEAMKPRGIPVSEVNDTRSIWQDEHTEEREMRFDVETPSGESFPTISYPVKHDDWEWEGDRYIAPLGGDTESILKSVGYDDDDIESFREEEII
ncbi:CaiB/BaiF CoA transferase family protein [Natronorubrum sp. FCH18a]|uniref:CaiB/BaiF CoA transferase family protein n=1 Tax=Natronorubrum sp. FCH18a TaxID=3447018 RepID=UPI003F514E85